MIGQQALEDTIDQIGLMVKANPTAAGFRDAIAGLASAAIFFTLLNDRNPEARALADQMIQPLVESYMFLEEAANRPMSHKKRLQMQKPNGGSKDTESSTKTILGPVLPATRANPVNQYTCSECKQTITTIDRHEGTTPFMLPCKATPGCRGLMVSAMYAVDQTLAPTHEWYKPGKLPKNPGMREHVAQGGLLIRPIKETT